jgi:hypothetical protein
MALRSREYVYFAINMAISIRIHHPDAYIQLLADNVTTTYIPYQYRELFDDLRLLSDRVTDVNGLFQPGFAKLHIYDFAHGDSTYLDVDGLLLRPLTAFKGTRIQPHVNNWYQSDVTSWNCVWMPLDEYKRIYQVPSNAIHVEINSSFIQYEHSPNTYQFFENAKANYIHRKKWKWGNAFPDELAFNAAFAQMGYLPDLLRPCYFEGTFTHESQIIDAGYYVLGLWAMRKAKNARVYQMYDRIATNNHRQLYGSPTPYLSSQLMKGKWITRKK